MTHKPPVPPGNQSPYPIAEPPHPHPPEAPGPVAESTREEDDHTPVGLIIGVVAGVAAVGVGLAATLLSRKPKSPGKPRRSRKRKA